jgi:hypothetical protein
MSEMNTLSEVLQTLDNNQIPEFRFTGTSFTGGDGIQYQSTDLVIIKVFRFEGDSDPSDMSVVYVFETKDRVRGYSVNAYGVYDDWGGNYDNFIRQVPERGHDEQVAFTL